MIIQMGRLTGRVGEQALEKNGYSTIDLARQGLHN